MNNVEAMSEQCGGQYMNNEEARSGTMWRSGGKQCGGQRPGGEQCGGQEVNNVEARGQEVINVEAKS